MKIYLVYVKFKLVGSLKPELCSFQFMLIDKANILDLIFLLQHHSHFIWVIFFNWLKSQLNCIFPFQHNKTDRFLLSFRRLQFSYKSAAASFSTSVSLISSNLTAPHTAPLPSSPICAAPDLRLAFSSTALGLGCLATGQCSTQLAAATMQLPYKPPGKPHCLPDT